MMDFKQRTTLYAVPWISLLMGWLLGVLAGRKSETFGSILLLASGLFFGLPHGAYDFWILSDAVRSKSSRSRSLISVTTIYLALALIAICIWYYLPSLALAGFLALSAWHFGSGDAIWETNARTDWLLKSLARGLIIISAPLTFYPRESSIVLIKLDTNSAELIISNAPYALIAGAFVLFISTVFQLFLKKRINNYQQIFVWFETIFLLIFFWLTTPILAVMIYFVGVHSWRHFLRLILYEQRESVSESNNLLHKLAFFHKRTLVLTLLSLMGGALILWFLDFKVSGLSDQAFTYLVLLSALTVPHTILITSIELKRPKLPFE